ncbi:MAG TPA: 3'-5' exonuclease [Acidimicrobiales bacterium]|nr:3'-5' exonuclease [Acidimicrobiales bacterium]
MRKWKSVPDLLVGFDTETTGLSVNSERAISYGFAVYRFGQAAETFHYFVIPDRPITEGARRVHGMGLADLEAMRGTFDVLSVAAGVTRAIQILLDYHRAGAYVVGANVANFDLEMLRRSALSAVGTDFRAAGFDVADLRIIDVIDHDLAIEARSQLNHNRSLTRLCSYYGIAPGGHDALEDARAAVEVFLEQVVRNNAGQRPFDLSAPASEAAITD